MDQMFEKEITDLYKRIPSSVCRPDCVKCCMDMIRFSPSEGAKMGAYEYDGRCPYLDESGKCSIYERRPLVCRLFGTSELLKCEGCTPERCLSAEETTEILRLYNGYRDGEEEDTR